MTYDLSIIVAHFKPENLLYNPLPTNGVAASNRGLIAVAMAPNNAVYTGVVNSLGHLAQEL